MERAVQEVALLTEALYWEAHFQHRMTVVTEKALSLSDLAVYCYAEALALDEQTSSYSEAGFSAGAEALPPAHWVESSMRWPILQREGAMLVRGLMQMMDLCPVLDLASGGKMLLACSIAMACLKPSASSVWLPSPF